MNFLRKLLVLIVIIIFSFIFYRLIKQRQLIITNIANSKITTEGMMSEDNPLYSKITNEINKVSIVDKPESKNKYNSLVNNTSLPINQFIIKGSANSAFSGNYISSEMVTYVLSRGCRFLDFQVFYLPTDESSDPSYDSYVGFSKNITSYNSTDSKNTMKWSDILTDTINSAFTTFTSKKYKTTNIIDPLFIQIRMNTDQPDVLYKNIQTNIETVLSLYSFDIFYKKPVTGNTNIQNILSNVIFIFDYEPNTGRGKYHNMTSNTTDIMRTFYSEINPSKYVANPPKQLTSTTTNINTFNILMPDDNIYSIQSNPNICSSIKNYGIQVNMMQYYINDMNLLKCEDLFQSYSAGIIPMTNSLSYIHNYGDDDKFIVFPELFS